MVNIIPSTTQNVPTRNQSSIKKIISVDKDAEPFFAIQILALKEATNDAAFFQNVEPVSQFSCSDGYIRYVVGHYKTQAEALANLPKIRAKGVKFQKAYIVNTANYNISQISTNSNAEVSANKNTDENTTSTELIDKSSKKDKFTLLRTKKKIIPVDKATEPPFAIQLLALKSLPQDPNFFENVSSAREFTCQDGFARYVFGQYESYEAAVADLSKTRSLSIKYKEAFVVNTSNFKIQASAFSSQFIEGKENSDKINESSPDISSLRTNKRIIPVDKLDPQTFSIQVLALKDIPKDAEFFEKLDVVREVACKDGMKRYLVGEYSTATDARADRDAIRKKGNKYKNAFIVSNQKIPLDATAFVANFNEQPNKNELPQNNSIINKKPVTVTGSNSIDKSIDKTTVTKSNSIDKPTVIKPTEQPTINKTDKVENITGTERKVIVDSKRSLEGDINNNNEVKQVNDEENLPSIRTNKKIIPVDKAVKPFYTVQILALKDAPTDPRFFDNLESAREFSCTDGYKRYVVGQYETHDQAAADLPRIKALSPKYKNAFVANTTSYNISSDFKSSYEKTAEVENPNETSDLNKTEKSAAQTVSVFDPNKIYTIQLTASRYPFYVSELKEFKEVFEFYMPDKVYRYSVGKYNGKEIDSEIKKVIALGYKEAFAVEWDKYVPYKIE